MIQDAQEVVNLFQRLQVVRVVDCVIRLQQLLKAFLIFSEDQAQNHFEVLNWVIGFWWHDDYFFVDIEQIKIAHPISKAFPVLRPQFLDHVSLAHHLREFSLHFSHFYFFVRKS